MLRPEPSHVPSSHLDSPALEEPRPRLFILHAEEDREVVEGFLVPALGLAAAEVLLSSRLPPGGGLVAELARGAMSPITLVVLSPAFLASPWLSFAEMLAQHHSLEPGSSGPATLIPALLSDCELPLLSRFRVALDFRERGRWEAEVARLRAHLHLRAPTAARPRCPYPGLRAFGCQDAERFHGREAELDELLARLRAGEREIYVVGSSGSGKSSLLAAGLVPQLAAQASAMDARYLTVKMCPGADPVAALVEQLQLVAAGCGRPAIATTDPVERLTSLLAERTRWDRALIIVDQLEELFTTTAIEKRRAFSEVVAQLRRIQGVSLVLALRSDFYGELRGCELLDHSERARARMSLRPLQGEALERAITAPARSVGVYVEPALVHELIRDAASEPGALPLLQETLVHLWNKLTRNLLQLSSYRALGERGLTGVAATMRWLADSAMAALRVSQRAVARRILLRLVHFGEGRPDTRRRQPKEALASCGPPEEVDAVLDHLVARRLLHITSQGAGGESLSNAAIVLPQVELSHEVLLLAWPTLTAWVRSHRTEELQRRALEREARAWQRRRERGRDEVGLLDDGQLLELQTWLTPEVARELGVDEEIEAFLAASRAAAEKRLAQHRALALAEVGLRRRRARQRVVVACVLAAFVVTLSTLGLYVWRLTQRLEELHLYPRPPPTSPLPAESSRTATIRD